MRKLVITAGLLALLSGGLLISAWPRYPAVKPVSSVAGTSRDQPASPVTDWPPVEQFCNTCHKLPPPNAEPRDLWPQKIREMYGYAQGDRPWPRTKIPPIDEPISYFMARAPETLVLPADATGSPPSPLLFAKHQVTLAGLPGPPAISCVKFVQLAPGRPVQLLISEMRHGLVALWTPSRPADPPQIIGRAKHPSRTTVVDLDQDGIQDVLVANLGVFWPLETDEGSVVWLRGRADGTFDTVPLIEGLNRVNEVQAADFDGDGDLDLVVGMFGNYLGGSIVYLENFTEDYAAPDFEPYVIDSRTGTSDVPLVDLNGDGRLDVVALQSQQHDHVLALLNTGKGRFRIETIYAAPHPRWGSTGIKLVDLDGDGDTDVLWNHGDSVQIPPVLRPYHGVSWLENRGPFPWVYHRLAHLPGAHTCQPVDLDGDGDLDIVSSVFIPAWNPRTPYAQRLETVVWFQQTAPGRYQRYVLEKGTAYYPCLDVGDWDGDGDQDVVIGDFLLFPDEQHPWNGSLTVLENRAVGPRKN